MYKICSKCKEEKLFSEFSKNKSQKDGYSYQCKSCVKIYEKANKNKLSEYRMKYYQDNKERIAEYKKANKEQIVEYRKSNKEQIAEKTSEYYRANKNEITAFMAEYYKANKEKFVTYSVEYRRANRGKFNAQNAKRRAMKLNATPRWLTKADYAQIEEFYTEAKRLKLSTGQEYHVDHIVPLQGENVCGLHVPWNLQVIPASENIKKSNKLIQD